MALSVVITEPGIDLIFTENPIFFAGGIIIGHDKIAKKTERLLINFFQRTGNRLPVHI